MSVYENKRSRLVLGDATDTSLFQEPFIDLTITSPPYNLNIEYDTYDDNKSYEDYLKFSESWMTNVFQWSKPNARFCINVPLDSQLGGARFICGDLTRVAVSCGWKYRTTIIWHKNQVTSRTAWGSWLSPSAPMVIAPVETILVLYRDDWKKPDISGKGTDLHRDEFLSWTSGVWVMATESAKRTGHPAPFPIELPHRLIKMFSWVGDTIFDPFAGSGSTLIASHNNQRECVGIEISEKYFDLASLRLSKEAFTLF